MRRLLALALTVTLVAAGLLAYYRMGPLPLRLDRAPAGDSHVLETLVNPGEGLVVRHPLGAQLNVPPQTFDRPTRVRVAPEEVVPLSHSLAAPVWSLEADGAEFARPVELVLSLLPDASSGETVETFAVFWDGHHWSRTPGLARADGSAVYVQATHFSLWSAGQDPVTLGDNHDTIPSILRLNVPERVEAGQEVEIGYAVANLGGSDLDGYGEVTVSISGAGGETQVSGGRVEGWDGTDGPLGSVAYIAGMDLAEPLSGISVVDAESLAPLRVPALTPGPARVQVRLAFYDRAGQPLSSAVAEQTITVSGSEPAEQVEPKLPERIDVVRAPGLPLELTSTGTAAEHFDAPDTFTGSQGRDVARGWGAYQTGVVGQFRRSASGGLQGGQAQLLEGHGASRLGIVRSVAGVRPSEPHYVSVQYRLLSSANASGTQRVRLGVDPTGGTDPGAASVTWAEGAVEGAWASLVLPGIQPEGNSLTVFLELTDPEGEGGVTAHLDSLEIQAQRAYQMPDLVLERIWTEVPPQGVCEGSSARMLIEVRNRGGGRAPSFDTVVGGTDGACGPWRVRGLEPAEAFVFACELTSPGTRSVRVIVDPANAIGESAENNNWLEEQVVVPACLPTPTPPLPPTQTPPLPPTQAPTAAFTPTPASTPTPTATPTAAPTPTATPAASGCKEAGAPLCLGSVVQFRYLDSDWTLSLEGWQREPDPDDARWVTVKAWGTITRQRRHEVERLLATTGDADLGRLLSLNLVDDHGHSHTAQGARLEGPLAVTARLQFEDVRELWGRFYFEVDGFPAPSAVSGATVQVGLPPLSVDGKPLQFLYLPGEEGESPRRTPTATPSLPAGVTVGDGSVEVMPYLTMSAAAQAASDGGLLTIELSFRNEDYVALRPNLGPALLVNSDWLYGAYLGREADEPVNWREAAAVWTELATKGVPPLTGGDAEPFVMTVYALAPAGQGPWQDPVLWLPKLDRALQLEVNTKK